MKTMILCVCAIVLTTGLFAQEKRKEVSVNFSSLNSFGLSYKSGTSKSLWRFNLLNSSISTYDDVSIEDNIDVTSHERQSYGIGASIGREFRKPVTKKLEFRYGFDVGFFYNYYQNETTYLDLEPNQNYLSTIETYTPSVNAVVGFNYLLSDNIAFGVEILPSISYRESKTSNIDLNSISEENNQDTSSFNFNLNNNFARLSLAYRF